MPKLPVLSGRELVRALAKAGFEPRRRKGSHLLLVKVTRTGRRAIVVPDYEEIDRGTLVEILRQAGLKRQEFFRLL
jgi:predicted RNA binding protein YcfA (HicA-like mRNA interferase family)